MTELETIFSDYINSVEQLHKSMNPLCSVLGLREAEMNFSGHTVFYQAVEQWTKFFLQAPSNEIVLENALDIILFSAAKYNKSNAQWYLIAVQEFAKPLIRELSPDQKEPLRIQYKKAYPRGKRLPLQNEIYKLLDSRL